jgi:hypothetical protein
MEFPGVSPACKQLISLGVVSPAGPTTAGSIPCLVLFDRSGTTAPETAPDTCTFVRDDQVPELLRNPRQESKSATKVACADIANRRCVSSILAIDRTKELRAL